MTNIMNRLKEAESLYERAGLHGTNGAALMYDAQAHIKKLTTALKKIKSHAGDDAYHTAIAAEALKETE